MSGRPGITLNPARLANNLHAGTGIRLLEFELDGVEGPRPLPGQFFLVECGGGREHMLRRPLSVYWVPRWDGGRGAVQFLVEGVGWGTSRLCSMAEGGTAGLLGPLGTPFQETGGSLLLVAGGIGIAPLHFLAREMDRAGGRYCLLAGFRSAAHVCSPPGELGGDSVVFTEDGALGQAGVVSEGVGERLVSGDYSRVIACGPEAMMASVAAQCESAGVRCDVSLVARMACGIGACRGCVRTGAGGRSLCVCTDGPTFDSREVVWHVKQPGTPDDVST